MSFLSVVTTTWPLQCFKDVGSCTTWEVRDMLFMQEVFACVVLACGTHNGFYVHTGRDITGLGEFCEDVFAVLVLWSEL
jgi:hypothetical protein